MLAQHPESSTIPTKRRVLDLLPAAGVERTSATRLGSSGFVAIPLVAECGGDPLASEIEQGLPWEV